MTTTDLETPMTRRFLRELWSPLRREVDAMAPGEVLTRSRGEWTRGCGVYNTALVSARRLREAYEGKRVWTVRVTPCKTQFTISHHLRPCPQRDESVTSPRVCST